jgi:hypothetical protein
MQLRTFAPNINPTQKLVSLLAKTDSEIKPRDVRELVEGQDQKNASQALANAKDAAINILPTVTAAGISGMMEKPSGGMFGNIGQGIGFVTAVAGLILDPIKAPFAAVIAIEESARGGILKLKSLATEGSHPEEEHIKHIYLSFIDKMNTTANLLINSGLEKKEDLVNKINTHKIEELIGLTILYSAYHSRNYMGVLLSDEYTLIRSNCPEVYLPLYDQFIGLKELIKSALNITGLDRDPNSVTSKKDAEKASQWISYIKSGKLLSLEENSQFSAKEIMVVNKIITQILELRQSAAPALSDTEEKVGTGFKMS